ncbi:DUF4347 domain-containing protein [Anabaena sp. PCC 7938]|uniref:Delta-60 repeat-containing protein n=1 Tax=Anabaena cylindrica (strain ATCC 27899 / PCC 7122) TaxID=272123 RepID=K9ZFN9_ANACC|nr:MULTISPECIES: DUF4347 domain-containing protein [Anabaena]AFZ57397.1 Delta-60 repeat-containing protein [Anabaena cylindrica PCC 7122]MCM2405832.1 DUF4347 domain-containing protein [Anabaena sp. CCAP 1446/1C]BAY05612.1 hypothetical protein NIES19_48860 [Anabaena cylindrica PCC 7122]
MMPSHLLDSQAIALINANDDSQSLVIIDSGLQDSAVLLSGVKEEITAIALNPEKDGIQQITEILEQFQRITTLHIVSHGSPGCLYLGNSQLNLDNFNNYAAKLQTWKPVSILIYGCNVAAGDAGEEFITKLHQTTGAKIAASTTRTGNAALGGNWKLEKTTEPMAIQLAFEPEVMANYQGVLADGQLDPSFGGGDGIVTTDFGGYEQARSVTVQSDGKLLVLAQTSGGDILIRYNPDGTIDNTFGFGTGKVYTVTGLGNAVSVKLQPDGKILVLSNNYNGGNQDMVVTRYNTDGSPNPFGNFGKVTIDFGGYENAKTLIVQPDGKILVAGDSNGQVVITRYLSSGVIDTSFGNAGKLNTYFPNGEVTNYIALQADGKIVAVSNSYNSSSGNNDIYLTRFNSDGTVDYSFGNYAPVITNLGGYESKVNVAIQADGKIVVAALTDMGGQTQIGVVRYNINGTLDTSFGGGDGIVTTPINSYSYGMNNLSLAVDTSGRIVVATNTYTNSNDNIVVVRYKPDGTLDTSFDGDGIANNDLNNNSYDRATALALQADGNIVVVGSTSSYNGDNIAVVRYLSGSINGGGQLDTSFSSDGIVTTDFGGYEEARSITMQSDGKLVVLAHISTYGDSLIRYNTDGTIDNSFGFGTGRVYTGTGLGNAVSVKLQSDGKILVLSNNDNGSNYDMVLTRYNADGSYDNNFGSYGKASIDFGSYENAKTLIIQSDGKILVAGDSNSQVIITRYLSSGVIDTTFGNFGKVTSILSNGDVTNYIAMQTDGKIVVVSNGYNSYTYSYDISLSRLNADGSLDTNFGNYGKVNTNLGGFHNKANVAVQADGKIVVATLTDSGGQQQIGVVRYNANGALDTTFGGGDGIVLTPLNLNNYYGTSGPNNVSLAFQSGGKILIGTTAYNGNNTDFALVRYNSDGSLDNSFNSNGIVLSNLGNNTYERATSLLVQADNNIVVAGSTNNNNGTGDHIAIVRYLGAGGSTGGAPGQLDSSFSGDGKVTTDFGFYERAESLAVQSDGKLVVLASTSSGNTLIRYNLDGTVDTSFGGNGSVPYIGGGFVVSAVTVQSDGKILVLSGNGNGSNQDIRLERYNSNGSIDSSFGNFGKAVFDFGGNEYARNLIVQTDGKILVAGESNGQVLLTRYLATGVIDNTFGGGTGRVFTNLPSTEISNYIALQSDNKILVVSRSYSNDIVLKRIKQDGTIDNSFGNFGEVITNLGGFENPRSVAVQADGKILVAGWTDFSGLQIALVRYNSNGTLDTSFGGGDGIVTTQPNINYAYSNTYSSLNLAIQSSGKIILAGTVYNIAAANSDLLAIRYNIDGTIDTSFDGDGIVTTNINGNGFDYGKTLALQADGNIVVGGYTSNGANDDIALVRYFGGSSSTTNQTPISLNLSYSIIAENQAVGTIISYFTTTDPDIGNTFTYSLVSGSGSVDNGLFSISGNQLKSNAGFNYEGQNSYRIRVRTTDQGGLFYEKQLIINISNVNETPTNLTISNSNVAENQATGTVIGALNTTDPDASNTFTYSLVAGTGSTDNALFTISGNQLKSNAIFDYESQNSYSIRVRTTDQGGLFSEKQLTIGITNVNDAPTNLTISNSNVDENSAVGTLIGNLSTSDADLGDAHTYQFVLPDNSLETTYSQFQIVGNQLLVNGALNYENTPSYNLIIRTTDSQGLFFDQGFSITINNLDTVINGTSANESFNTTDEKDIIDAVGGNDSINSTFDNLQQNDTINGNAGTDTLIVSGGSVTDGLTIDLNNFTNQLLNITGTTVLNFEVFDFNSFVGSVNFTGNSLNNYIKGGSGNDTFNGGAGADTSIGSLGNDVYYVDNVGDIVTELVNEGTDTVYSTIKYTLGANLENLILQGTTAINGTGNALNNSIIGNIAANILSGGTGADTLIGGLGNDVYYVDNAGDTVTELLNEGTDTVYSTISYTLTGNVEKLILQGTTAINGTGNELNNTITGNSVDNTLIDGVGNDTLNGGTGADALIGGVGNDIYYVDDSGDIVTELLNEGTDTVYSTVSYTLVSNVEKLTLQGTTAINGTGNALNNTITGNSGDNILIGDLGNDTLTGLTGADQFTGGKGNDTLNLGLNDGVTDIVNYGFGDGVDKVYQFVRGGLDVGGDRLQFTGITNIDVITIGSNTEMRVSDGISGTATGQLLMTLYSTTGFTASDVNVNLFGANFLFS